MTAPDLDPLARLDFTPELQCECKKCVHATHHIGRCEQHATYRVRVHQIDHCTHPSVHATGGAKITLMCPQCMFDATNRAQEIAAQVVELARLVNFHRICRGCGIDLKDHTNFVEVAPL